TKRVGQLLAIKSDLPWKQSVGFHRALGEFRNGGVVGVRKRGKGELAVVIKLDEIVVLIGRISRIGLVGVGDVADEKLPVRPEKRLHLVRQRINGLVRNQALGVFSPSE